MKNRRLRNSVSYGTNSNNSTKKKEWNPYGFRILRNLFFNKLDQISKSNSDFVKNLNNTFRDYELNINQKDVKIPNNLYNISVNRVLDMKNKLKLSDQLLREYEDNFLYITSSDYNKNNKTSLYESKDKNFTSLMNNSFNMDNNKDNREMKNSNDNIFYSSKDCTMKKSVHLSDLDVNHFKRYSVKCDLKNNENKYMKIIINEKKIQKKMKKIEQLTKLYNAIEVVEKQELVDENKYFKIDNKDKVFIPFSRREKMDKILLNYNKKNYLCKIRKKNNYTISKDKSIFNKSNTLLTFNKNKNNDNNEKSSIYSYYNKNDKQMKITPKKFVSRSNDKSNSPNINDLNIDSLSNISRTPYNTRNKRDYLFLTSFPHIKNLSNTKKRNIKKSLLNISPENKSILKSNHSLKTFRTNKSNQTSMEINPIIHKIIKEGKKINEIISNNYIKYKRTKIEDNMTNILEEEHKMDLEKLRKNLKLKDSKGIYGKINVIEIMDNKIEKMRKIITKKQIKILQSIARAMIKEDLLLNKRLVYNVGIENRLNMQKYLHLYNDLTNTNQRKRAIDTYGISDNNLCS